jgi:lactam utilization protein B
MAQSATQLAVALNADVGEEYGNWTVDDAEVLSVVSDTNIVCRVSRR